MNFTPPQDPYCKCVFLGQSKKNYHYELYKGFDVVMSDLYLAYFVPQRDLWMLCCEYKLIITRISFHQILLYLNMPQIN